MLNQPVRTSAKEVRVKILVTGAGGFLGRHLTERLTACGDEVTALVWPAGTGAALTGSTAQVSTIDICDAAAVRCAVQGHQVVIHCAGKVDDWGPPEEYSRVNVQGTCNLLEACRAAGVGHLIHVSSLVVLGIPEKNPLDETSPYAGRIMTPYQETKLLAEKAVLKFHAAHGMGVTILRPGILWGPGDSTIFPRMARLARMRLLVPVGTGDTILCLTHVENMVAALLLVCRRDRPEGRIYHITDTGQVFAREYFQSLAAAVGRRQLPVRLPLAPARFAALLWETGARILNAAGIPAAPLLTRYGLALWSSSVIAPPDRACRELGYAPQVSFRDGIERLARWYAKTNP